MFDRLKFMYSNAKFGALAGWSAGIPAMLYASLEVSLVIYVAAAVGFALARRGAVAVGMWIGRNIIRINTK